MVPPTVVPPTVVPGATVSAAITRAALILGATLVLGCSPSVRQTAPLTGANAPIRTFDALEAHAAFAATDSDTPHRSETFAVRGVYVDGRRVEKNTSQAPLPDAATGPVATFDGEIPEGAARCPADMALVGDRVCVDRWEASLVHIVDAASSGKAGKAGKAGKHEEQVTPFESVDNMTAYRAVSRAGVIPQGYISGREAETACRASGKRLCTAGEWEQGCRGSKGTQFPYGNERRAHVCNDDIRPKHPVIEAVAQAGLPRDRTWKEGMNLPLINQLPDSLLPTGDRSECVTPEGLYDMVGNLHEWVAEADGTFRGGYYMDTSKNGDGCSYQTTAHEFDYHDYSTGFRCCADPDSIE